MYPPEVPVMLAGVSMGGLVATLAALDGGIEPDGLSTPGAANRCALVAGDESASRGGFRARQVSPTRAHHTRGGTFEAVQRRGGGA